MIQTAQWRNDYQTAKSFIADSQWTKSISCFKSILEQPDNNVPSHVILSIHRRLADAYISTADMETALVHANIVVQDKQNASERDFGRKSSILDFLGRPKEARAVLISFAEKFRKNKILHENTKRPNIVVIALPKSGSTSISSAIAAHLNYSYLEFPNRQGTGFFSNSVPVARCYQNIENIGAVIHSHILPRRNHVNLLSAQTDLKFIVHVRDPREALVSALDMVHRRSTYQFMVRKPDLLELPLEGQLDWMISNYLPVQIDWISRWWTIAQTNSPIKIKLSTFSDLQFKGQDATALDLIKAIGLDVHCEEMKTERRRYNQRKLKGSWQELFSQQQKNRAADAIPESIRSQFEFECKPA